MGKKRKGKWTGYFLPNDRFGKWSIIDGTIQIDPKRKEAQVQCKCDCGTISWVWCLHLQKGNSKSCGCSNHDRSGENHVQFTGAGCITGNFLNSMQRRASTRGRSVEVGAKYLNDIYMAQNQTCALSGLPISVKDKTASVDRIDSTQGYVSGNIQWLHKDVNVMKNGFSTNYFVGMCQTIASNNAPVNIDLTQGDSFKFGMNKAKKTNNPVIDACLNVANPGELND